MSRKFKVIQDYYDENFKLYKKNKIEIKEGVTVLVGCNGIGKTTLLKQIISNLKKENIPYVRFDNLSEGGSNAVSSAGFYGDFAFMANSMCSSEGENIVMNLGNFASRLRHFIKTGEDISNKNKVSKAIAAIIAGEEVEEEKAIPNERWILLDAIDSGLSVDNVVDVKELLFKTILEDAGNTKVYIVVSANEYEMARNEQCFDVYNCEYIKFKDYEDYRNFILNSKKEKDKR